MKPININPVTLILLLLSGLMIYLQTSVFISDNSIGHNAVSNLLPALAPFHQLGVPYRDYWDIYPPGIYIFWSLIGLLFGKNLALYKLLHMFLCGSFIGVVFSTFKKTNFSGQLKDSWPVALLFLVFMGSTLTHPQLLQNVLIASLVSVLGIRILLSNTATWIQYGLAGFLLLFSGMIKDPFIFGFLVPITLALANKNWKQLSWTLAGGLLALAVNFCFLEHFNILGNYLEILNFKRSLTPTHLALLYLSPNRYLGYMADLFSYLFFAWPLLISLIIAGIVASTLTKKPELKFTKNEKISVLFFFFTFIGFDLQHRSWGPYTLQMLAPLCLILNAMYGIFARRFGKRILFGAVIFCLIPAIPVIQHIPINTVVSPSKFLEEIEKPWATPTQFPGEIAAILKTDPRILHLYGWGSPLFYFVNDLKPFNRFFIVHPNIMADAQQAEWIESFKNELPKVVIYGDGPGADMDVQRFEAGTIQLGRILKECYHSVEGYFVLNHPRCEGFDKHPEKYIASKYLRRTNPL